MRPPSQRTIGSRVVRTLLGPLPFGEGLDTADGTAWVALLDLLDIVVTAELGLGAACVMVQTGDVEAFGMSPGGHFTGYGHLHNEVWPVMAARGVTAVDVYGNHDIWPGTLPALAFGRQAHDVICDLPAFADAWPLPRSVATASPLVLRFHRLNTVISNAIGGGLLARGGVGTHPIRDTWSSDLLQTTLDEFSNSVRSSDQRPLLNVAIMHHPPHLFDPNAVTSFTTGHLEGRAALCEALSGLGVGLVIAGHRHRHNPPLGGNGPTEQPPLPKGTVQLVAQSPTAAGSEKSLSVYRLHWSEGDASVDIDRLTFAYTPATGYSDPRLESNLATVPLLV